MGFALGLLLTRLILFASEQPGVTVHAPASRVPRHGCRHMQRGQAEPQRSFRAVAARPSAGAAGSR